MTFFPLLYPLLLALSTCPDKISQQSHSYTPNKMFSVHSESDDVLKDQGVIPGPTFDASTLEKEEDRARFHRNLAAVIAVLTGSSQQSVAKEHNMATSTLSRLVQRTKELGQIACVPHGSYHRDCALRCEFQQLICKLYTHPLRPTVMAVYEDARITRLAEELSKREGTVVCSPSYWQVWKFLKVISHEASVKEARSGLKHPLRERMSLHSFVLSIAYPALICQGFISLSSFMIRPLILDVLLVSMIRYITTNSH